MSGENRVVKKFVYGDFREVDMSILVDSPSVAEAGNYLPDGLIPVAVVPWDEYERLKLAATPTKTLGEFAEKNPPPQEWFDDATDPFREDGGHD